MAKVLQIESDLNADRNLLGGKAASLVALLKLDAPVPPAFVLTTEAYRNWAANPNSAALRDLVAQGLEDLERRIGRRLGDQRDGFLVSVRSGAPASMPGMMDTVLNIGVGPARPETSPFFLAARARFLWQYAELVLGMDSAQVKELRTQFAAPMDYASVRAVQSLLSEYAERTGLLWPASPTEEIVLSVEAVFRSWQCDRARLYRRMHRISESLGTAATIQVMVFGNRDSSSGSGVAFSRDPTSGENVLTGEYLSEAQGEEIVSGRETASGLELWRQRQPEAHSMLEALAQRLETETRTVYEIEFTVESGTFYALQCRPARLTARAAARVAVDMHDEGRLSTQEALVYAQEHGFDPMVQHELREVQAEAPLLASGLPVGGGVATGRVALSAQKVSEFASAGIPAVFVAMETSPSHLSVMQRSAALVTMRGGATCHAAVVAREMGKPCVVGVGGRVEGTFELQGGVVPEGTWITVDGDRGNIYSGDVTKIGVGPAPAESKLREWAKSNRYH